MDHLDRTEMTVETELKLHISPEHLQQLKRHPFIRSLSGGHARTQKLYSIYYDTPDLELRQHMMALRLRRVGKQWIQTLKGGGQANAGLHQRNEWETPVPSEQLNFDALKACGGELPRGVHNRLQPVFVTDFSRNVRLVDFEGAQIELCMDSGEIRAGQSSCPISELELELRLVTGQPSIQLSPRGGKGDCILSLWERIEVRDSASRLREQLPDRSSRTSGLRPTVSERQLKSGEPQQLFRLALALLDIVPLEVEHTSKAEYGYLLFSAAKPSVSKPRFPALKKSQSIASALQSMIGACLAHVQSNVPGALLKLDEEYLHQVRVGLRRLRVVLAIAQRFRADDELTFLREQVAKLCVELGRSRDWDVFVTQTLAPICTRLPEHAGLREVLATSERARKKQHAGMEKSLASQDFQRLLLRFGAWMYGTQTGETEITLVLFATQVLQRRSKQVAKHGKALVGEDAAQLHLLRIACKKLRYSTEMFGSLFNAAKTKSYVTALAELQDILGILNDIAVAHRLLDELDNAARHDTLALVRGWMEHDYAERVAEFGKAWKRFAAQKGFWN
jgi:inorganic triphosphatase YgiF